MESSVKDRLKAAREEKAKREATAHSAAEARELATLELESKLSAELGERGVHFEIVETVEGPVAVKLGEAVLHQRFQNSKVTETDIHDYVFPCVVYPTQPAYLELVGRRPVIAVRCANALAGLFGAKAADAEGKF